MKLRNWLEKQSNDMNEIKCTINLQEQNLRHHVRRTNLLEENVKMLRKDFNPIKMHVAVVSGVTKALLGLLTAVGVIAGIVKVFFL